MSGRPNNFGAILGGATGTSVGGDLGGTLPGPIVVGVQGVPIDTPTADGSVATYVAADGRIEWEIISPTGFLPVFNVQHYGAVGDDTADDTAAIEAAIAAADLVNGGTIYFPPGTYKITSTITLTGKNYHLLGAGSRYGPSRVHMATSNTTALSFAPSATTLRTSTSRITDLVISGPGSASSGQGVLATNDLHMENCFVYGFYDGVYLETASYYSYLRACTFTDCDRAGVVLDSTNNTTIDTCRFTGTFSGSSAPIGALQYGIFIGCPFPSGLNNRIINSSIEYFTADGIYASGFFSGEIGDNYFESQQSSSGHAHINLGPSHGATGAFIHGNYFQGDGTSGFNAIMGTTTDRITVQNNYFGVNAGIGIAASGGGNSNWLLINNKNSPAGTFSLPTSSYTLDPASPPLSNPMTTEGDLIYEHSSAAARLAIGAAGKVLTSNGTDPAWGDGPLTTKGDLYAYSTAGARVAVGSDGKVLTADSTAPAGVSWQTPETTSRYLVTSSSPSNPLTFADIVQTSGGDDFVYSS